MIKLAVFAYVVGSKSFQHDTFRVFEIDFVPGSHRLEFWLERDTIFFHSLHFSRYSVTLVGYRMLSPVIHSGRERQIDP